jgi:hypothetical protein
MCIRMIDATGTLFFFEKTMPEYLKRQHVNAMNV